MSFVILPICSIVTALVTQETQSIQFWWNLVCFAINLLLFHRVIMENSELIKDLAKSAEL